MSGLLPLFVEPVAPEGADGGEVTAQALVFRHASRLHVVVMAKVVLELVADRPMRVASGSAPVFRDDDLLDANGVALSSSDARPLLRRTDVTLVGEAFAPAQNPLRRMLARLAVVRPLSPGGPPHDGLALVDKSIGIIGQRYATAAQPNPFPAAFVRLPITYALALGGPHDPQNPVGIGREADAQGVFRLPSIVPAGEAAPDAAPLGFGPIPRRWPARALGLSPRRDVVNELPADVDFEHFHAAPTDQRVDLLRGDEWVYLENLHPRWPRLVSRLPDLRGEARVRDTDGIVQSLALRVDALAIQSGEGRIEVTCSGAFSVENEEALRGLSIAAAITTADRKPAWPTPPAEQRTDRKDFAGTMVIELPTEFEDRPTAVLDEPTTPVAQVGDARPAARTTLLIELEAPPPLAAIDTTTDAPPSTQVFESTFERHRTMVIVPDAPPSTHAPFRVGKPRSKPREVEEELPIGAPWEEPGPVGVRTGQFEAIAAASAAQPATQSKPSTSFEKTHPSESLSASARTPAVSPAVPPEAHPPSTHVAHPVSRPPPRKAGADLWAKPEASAPLPPSPPKPKPGVPAPGVKQGSLYERFRKG